MGISLSKPNQQTQAQCDEQEKDKAFNLFEKFLHDHVELQSTTDEDLTPFITPFNVLSAAYY